MYFSLSLICIWFCFKFAEFPDYPCVVFDELTIGDNIDYLEVNYDQPQRHVKIKNNIVEEEETDTVQPLKRKPKRMIKKKKLTQMKELNGPFYCDTPGCNKFYTRKRELNRHKKYACQKEPQFQCQFCSLRTTHKYNLFSHMRNKHSYMGNYTGPGSYVGHVL